MRYVKDELTLFKRVKQTTTPLSVSHMFISFGRLYGRNTGRYVGISTRKRPEIHFVIFGPKGTAFKTFDTSLWIYKWLSHFCLISQSNRLSLQPLGFRAPAILSPGRLSLSVKGRNQNLYRVGVGREGSWTTTGYGPVNISASFFNIVTLKFIHFTEDN